MGLPRQGTDGLRVLQPTHGEEPLKLASVDLTASAAALWADLKPDEAALPVAERRPTRRSWLPLKASRPEAGYFAFSGALTA